MQSEKPQTNILGVLPHNKEFLNYLDTRNYSSKTIYSYKRDLLIFANFLSDILKIEFVAISKHHIDEYKTYLLSQERKTSRGVKAKGILNAGSINRALTALRSYILFLADYNYEAPIDPSYIRLVKLPHKPVQAAKSVDLERLVEAPSKFEKDKMVALRNRAALETLFASGMRISELISLKKAQIDGTGRIFIEGMGKKQRFTYLTERAKRHIDNYLSERRGDDSPYLFIAKRGLNASNKNMHISPNYLQMKIKKYRQLLSINVPTSAHSLRHGFALHLAENVANPEIIKTLFCHESRKTGTRYVHDSEKYTKSAHTKL